MAGVHRNESDDRKGDAMRTLMTILAVCVLGSGAVTGCKEKTPAPQKSAAAQSEVRAHMFAPSAEKPTVNTGSTGPAVQDWQIDFSKFTISVAALWRSFGEYASETAAQKQVHIEKFNQAAQAAYVGQTVAWYMIARQTREQDGAVYADVTADPPEVWLWNLKTSLTKENAAKIGPNARVAVLTKLSRVAFLPAQAHELNNPKVLTLRFAGDTTVAVTAEEPVGVTVLRDVK
jgi:hypothetical protein